MADERPDHFFSNEDLMADYGRKYKRKKVCPKNQENVNVNRNVVDCHRLSSLSAINTSYGGLSNSRPNSVHSSQTKYRSPMSTITNLCTPTSVMNIRETPKGNTIPVFRPRFDTRSIFGSTVLGSSLSNIANFDNSSHYAANQREEGGCSTQFIHLTGRGNMTAKNKVVSLNRHKPLPRKSKEVNPGFGRKLFEEEIVTDDEELNESDCGSMYGHVIDEDHDIDDPLFPLQQTNPRVRRRVVLEEYQSLGGPTAICSKCNARMWKEERVNKNVMKGTPIFFICCLKGAVKLPSIPHTPPYLLGLYNDPTKGPNFHRLSRLYNAMFAFTYSGGNIDHSINNGRAPYMYRLNGQNHHVLGSLIPNNKDSPKFCQLYIYDTINEVDNRLRWVNVQDRQIVDREVVQGLITMLDETNQLVDQFRQQRDLYESEEVVDLEITLKVIRSESGRDCHISSTDEVAGIMVGDTEDTCGERYIVVHDKIKGLVCVSYVHPKLTALQYPLLFPRGEDEFHPKIKFQKNDESKGKARGFLSMKDYYTYSFQVRDTDGLTPRLGGRLFQQYLVDAFSSIEQTRLWWFCTHQTTIRNELYNNICDLLSRGDVDTSNTGKGIIFPAGFIGSKRYMQQNFQDALAVCRFIGHPDIFLTMTCNPLWDEIQKMMEYLPGCIAPNCPDIISRVFRLKLDQLLVDIKTKKYFGVCNGVMYCARTTFDDSGFPIYMRRRQDITVEVRKIDLDNQWVVPYNLDLLSLRTVNGVIHSSFREACKEYGLLDDDKEWHKVLSQACTGGLPPQIRQLFVHIIVNCKVTNLKSLWLSRWRSMVEDILLKRRQLSGNSKLTLIDTQLQFYALEEIDDLLRSIGKSLKKYDQLPQPPSSYLNNGANNLIIEETSYDIHEMDSEHRKLLRDCGLFFVYGSGGCGKTFLWRTLICKLRSQGKIVLPVTSSGITATLMSGGRTAHSRFKIPIDLDEFSTCNISHDSNIAQLIKQTNLIIWDEVPMQYKYAFECLDRSLKDIMKAIDPARYEMSFGGITIVLGGDFRQILPVITYGDRGDIVAACITSEDLKLFAQWVLNIGNGQVPPPPNSNPLIENQILIPSRFCDLATENTVENMISSTFPNFSHYGTSSQYLSERAILTLTNQTVGQVNSVIVDMLPGESVCYLSVDSAEEFGGTDEDPNQPFPVEYLNSLNVTGLPYHDLKLKVGAVVMLIQNLNQILGLCNGTRMIITKYLKFCVECEVICGTFAGTKHYIP
ncbi:uncharacterized protein LOC141714425 [Apium graveolens]|uniref:uncharacterized protein LOC141714425 n=1 Tax=Apium graveolens TaxID=4045 RepID=UPI003D7BFC23